MEKEIYTVNELANYLCTSESLIRKQIRENILKPFRVGKRILFDKKEIEKFIQEQIHNNPIDNYQDILKA